MKVAGIREFRSALACLNGEEPVLVMRPGKVSGRHSGGSWLCLSAICPRATCRETDSCSERIPRRDRESVLGYWDPAIGQCEYRA